jgi:hypothetical protein
MIHEISADEDLSRRTAAPPVVLTLLPPASLPVLRFLEFAFTVPQITDNFQDIKPEELFSTHEATHTSLDCFKIQAPSSDFLTRLQACAGQAMRHGRISIRHWDRKGIYLPFDALGTWARILEVDAAKEAWDRALQWMEKQHQTIPQQYATQVMSLLRNVPWKGHIKGLGSGLTITDMAGFLSKEWLSDSHIHTMLAVTRSLRHNTISNADPCIEIVSPDFASHLRFCPVLTMTPTKAEYSSFASKSLFNLGEKLESAVSGMRIAAVAFSPDDHWACLFIDSRARTICWGDSTGRDVPDGFEARLRAWLAIFLPDKQFLPLRHLSCARQTDSYSCGIISVNTLKHHIFGDDLWTTSRREVFRIQEFLDIMEFSECWRVSVSISALYAIVKYS